MKYEYREIESCLKKWKDDHKREWPYLSQEDLIANGADAPMLFADVALDKKKTNGSFLSYCGRKLKLNAIDESISTKMVIGYIPCVNEDGEKGFLRIIRKKRKILLFLIPLLLLIGLLIGGWYFLSHQNTVDLDEAAISYQMPNGMKNDNPQEIMIPVFNQLKTNHNSNTISVGLVNPEGNPCYFKYKIVLKESKKTIYESKWIEPGTAVVEIEIKEKLKIGTYPITIKVESGSLDDPSVALNGGEIESTLKVE